MSLGFKTSLTYSGVGIAVLLLLFITAVPAQAISNSDRHDMLAQRISGQQTAYEDSLSVLKSKPQEEWSPLEIQTYLFNALWVVQYGVLQYKHDHENLPDTLESLAGTEFIPLWPENPFNDFLAMEVYNDLDGFMPGDLVWLICPPEEYSGISNPRPLSYEIGVYGSTIEFEAYGNPDVALNKDWAVIPEGTLYMAGSHSESGKHLKEKYEKRKREIEEEEEKK